MDNGDNGASAIHDSFLTGGQYIVQADGILVYIFNFHYFISFTCNKFSYL